MVRLPLLINKQRIKTLEELRENFNLTELIERYQGGQLRAWLNCWDFISELEQVEALSPDLPELEFAETLCRIFGVEGDAKEQALTAFREEQEKREEQQQEAERQQKLREQEEQRKVEQTKPLTLDEIEFDWQVAEGPKIDLLASGTDRFVAIQNEAHNIDRLFFYSYDGLHWEKAFKWRGSFIREFYCCNNSFIFHHDHGNEVHYSSDSIHWETVKIDDESRIIKIIWANGLYVALCEQQESYIYTEEGLFRNRDKRSSWERPVIYTAPDLSGPWHKEKINTNPGDVLTDVTFFKENFIFTGHTDFGWYVNKHYIQEQFYYKGPKVNELKASLFYKPDTVIPLPPSKIWSGRRKCFRCALENDWKVDLAYMTEDGSQWTKIKYGISELVDAGSCLVARLPLPDSPVNGFEYYARDIGFHLSLDGINWRKLNAPLQNGKIAYLDGKLLIMDGNKLAVGTLKIAHKSNTPSCSTHSCNTSTEDRDLHYNVELSAEEAKSGTIKEVTVTRTEICSLCSGSGRESGAGERSCTNCNGCGLVQGSKSIKVRIPADVKSGAKLRIRGQGNAGRGEAQPGDLYVHITVREEPSVSPSQTNSTNHTTPLKEIADAMNPLKNPAVLIFPAAGVTKAVSNILKNK